MLEREQWRTQDLVKGEGSRSTTGGVGAMPSVASGFLRFLQEKHSV